MISDKINSFNVATKYLNLFVLINPFLNSNSRICRLILNALLLKYIVVAVVFSGSNKGRKEYFGIIRRALEDLWDN